METLERLSLEARDEIGESSVDISAEIEAVKSILSEKHNGLRLPPNFDDFLLRCLRVKKFDSQRAAKLVSQYFKLMSELSDMHSLLMPSIYTNLYNELGIAALKYRDSHGRIVLLARQEQVPPALYNFDQSLASSILMIDEVVRTSVENQRLGIVFVCDWKGYGFAHFRQLSPSRLRSAAKLFQDAFPVRFKAFHFIRNPFLVSCLYSIVKPFLREKLQNRVHFHGHDLKSFYKHVSPDILPEFLGGKLPDNDYADMELTANLVNHDDYYKEVLQYGYTK